MSAEPMPDPITTQPIQIHSPKCDVITLGRGFGCSCRRPLGYRELLEAGRAVVRDGTDLALELAPPLGVRFVLHYGSRRGVRSAERRIKKALEAAQSNEEYNAVLLAAAEIARRVMESAQ